jgi:hypothetical protein
MDYVARHAITREGLEQQFIDPKFTSVPPDRFQEWLDARTARLAASSNRFLSSLRNGL